jgi:xanthine dehydrogenase molybdopterin-binding subunit B
MRITSKNIIDKRYKSAIETILDSRSVSRAEQSYEAPIKTLWPITQPMPKINAYSQTCGETRYTDDIPATNLQLHCAFILTTVANAKIEKVNIENAMQMPGVKTILLAKDIPGINSFMPKPFQIEPLFADTEVYYAGQPIGLVVAANYEQAKRASYKVEVIYTDVKKPILTIADAIKENSFHEKPTCGDLVYGDARTAIKDSKNILEGEIDLNSSQFNFYIEVAKLSLF